MTYKLKPNAISKFLNTRIIGDYFDYWSIVHFGVGGLLALIIDNWKTALGLMIVWELFEYVLWGILFQRESILNIGLDITLGMLGFILIRMVLTGRI